MSTLNQQRVFIFFLSLLGIGEIGAALVALTYIIKRFNYSPLDYFIISALSFLLISGTLLLFKRRKTNYLQILAAPLGVLIAWGIIARVSDSIETRQFIEERRAYEKVAPRCQTVDQFVDLKCNCLHEVSGADLEDGWEMYWKTFEKLKSNPTNVNVRKLLMAGNCQMGVSPSEYYSEIVETLFAAAPEIVLTETLKSTTKIQMNVIERLQSPHMSQDLKKVRENYKNFENRTYAQQ